MKKKNITFLGLKKIEKNFMLHWILKAAWRVSAMSSAKEMCQSLYCKRIAIYICHSHKKITNTKAILRHSGTEKLLRYFQQAIYLISDTNTALLKFSFKQSSK